MKKIEKKLDNIVTDIIRDSSNFPEGSKYLKADFHLHTEVDKEFKTETSIDEEYTEKYVNELKKKEIKIGAITNHNKFDKDEFEVIQTAAMDNDIFLLPGVELSVNDGKHGLHTLVIFAPEDSEKDVNNTSKIEKFLSLAFKGKSYFDTEGSPLRCDLNLDNTIKELNGLKCHYFLILAHANNTCGFFKELDGGRIKDFLRSGYFRKYILACQNVSGSSKSTFLNNWVKEVAKESGRNEVNYKPGFISASDPKKIEDIGTKYSFLKIGDYSFEAVKFALMNHELRVKDEVPQTDHPCIKRIRIDTGKAMSCVDVSLNCDMTNLIGIRGSGKSALIEAIRYALELEAKEDAEYKEGLLGYAIGSGGKIILEVVTKGQEYRIERIMGERGKIYRNDEYVPNLYPSSMFPVVYYGQKDIQKQSMEREQQIELIDQFIKEELQGINEQILEKETKIKDIFKTLYNLREKVKKKGDYDAKKASLEDKIAIFEKMKIADKLQKDANFKKDELILERVTKFTKNSKENLSDFKEKIENGFSAIIPISSKENPNLFQELETRILNLKETWCEQIEEIENSGNISFEEFEKLKSKFFEAREKVQEEIAKIKREIDVTEVSPDDYGKFIKELENVKVIISEIEKYNRTISQLEEQKKSLYSELQKLWYKQWSERIRKKEEINTSQTVVQIDIEYKGNKKTYSEFIINFFKGTGLRANKLEKITETYSDNIELSNSLENKDNFKNIGFTDSEWFKFKERFQEQEEVLSLFRVPDLIEIKYKGRSIQKLSLGQRASSLLLLLLTQENSPVIMDQPEDDLDNQTIYEGLIKRIIEVKSKRQIVFATHNPNIPVLGDCEQVVIFKSDNEKIKTEHGSIDRKYIQENIVDIMEGGEEAFTKRKEIYNQWTL
jgi:chromosome segregation protein